MADERIAKLMARRGLCSRREAERLIEAGLVEVNGKIVRQQGVKVSPEARIELREGGAAKLERAAVTLLLNKPVGVVSILPESGQTEARALIRAETAHGPVSGEEIEKALGLRAELAVAGRLDRNSRGLLVLTTDGVVARRIIAGSGVEKEYLVCTRPQASSGMIARLNGSLQLDGRRLRPMRVEAADPSRLRFVLVEGRRHQIRRLCRRVGLRVVDLLRTRIGPFALDGLSEGKWRPARPEEMEQLRIPRPR